ncbi:hypothetical protein CC80DRAFT_563784 [Byssothecium circinans]|uniref:Uncharacterized protein n=1 Tax=Byssothecium circinans TaxID=147558 RepID=A0A6A5TTF7_9PLEO|nr:hypothetical protein CC80DRAFT_563784 [Byssothecium circinans]
MELQSQSKPPDGLVAPSPPANHISAAKTKLDENEITLELQLMKAQFISQNAPLSKLLLAIGTAACDKIIRDEMPQAKAAGQPLAPLLKVLGQALSNMKSVYMKYGDAGLICEDDIKPELEPSPGPVQSVEVGPQEVQASPKLAPVGSMPVEEGDIEKENRAATADVLDKMLKSRGTDDLDEEMIKPTVDDGDVDMEIKDAEMTVPPSDPQVDADEDVDMVEVDSLLIRSQKETEAEIEAARMTYKQAEGFRIAMIQGGHPDDWQTLHSDEAIAKKTLKQAKANAKQRPREAEAEAVLHPGQEGILLPPTTTSYSISNVPSAPKIPLADNNADRATTTLFRPPKRDIPADFDKSPATSPMPRRKAAKRTPQTKLIEPTQSTHIGRHLADLEAGLSTAHSVGLTLSEPTTLARTQLKLAITADKAGKWGRIPDRYMFKLRLRIRVPESYLGSAEYMRVLESFYAQHEELQRTGKADSPYSGSNTDALSPSGQIAASDSDSEAEEIPDTIYTTTNPFDAAASTAIPLPAPPPPTTFTFPPFPNVSPKEIPHFVNGARIAVENIIEDHAGDPDLPLLVVVGGLRDEKPTLTGDDTTSRRFVLAGAEWVYGAVEQVCFEREGGTVSLGAVGKGLEEWILVQESGALVLGKGAAGGGLGGGMARKGAAAAKERERERQRKGAGDMDV